MANQTTQMTNQTTQTKKTRLASVAAVLFYIGFITELLIVVIDKSHYVLGVEGLLFRATFVLFAVKIVLTKYSVKEWLIMAGFALLGFHSYFLSDRDEVLRLVVMIAASKGLLNYKMMKTAFYVTLAGVVTIVLLALTGLYGSMVLEADYGRGLVESRYSLGMGHPNAAHCMALMLLLLGIYLYGRKLRSWHYAVLFLANIGLYLLTDSRTGFIATAAAVIGAMVLSYASKLRTSRILYYLGGFFVLATVFFAVASALWYSPDNILETIDGYLNWRVKSVYIHGPIDTWGIFSPPENTYYFDMAMGRMLYWYGYFPTAVYVAVMLLILRRSHIRDHYEAYLMVVILALYGVAESHIISVYLGRNILLMMLLGTWPEYFTFKSVDATKDDQECWLWQLPISLVRSTKQLLR